MVVAEVAAMPDASRADLVWAHPESGLRAAAFGVAERREGASLRSVLAGLPDFDYDYDFDEWPEDMPGPWFGAAAFDGTLGPDWAGFSPLRFTLPAVLAWSKGSRHFLAAFGPDAPSLVRLSKFRGHPMQSTLSTKPGGHGSRVPRPRTSDVRRIGSARERERWEGLVARALGAIREGALDKVVLARAVEVEAGADIDTGGLLGTLQEQYPGCRAFLVRGEGGVFVGATPEVLCHVDGDRITTEALAGSARPGSATDLLGSRKDLREHRWVVEHMVGALSGVADSLQRKPEPGLRTLANVVHLHTPISARLAKGRTVADVVAALHPTPAVAGVPTAAALQFIRDHEHLDRGLYAGLVGWVGPRRAELAVALRSALVRGRHARLFVGAGIVDGSSPESEWMETELKAQALLGALGVAP